MALPSEGAISLNQVNIELKKEGNTQISLNDADVRNLAKIPEGTISFNDLRGKSAGDPDNPETPQDCHYYFVSKEDFKARIDSICAENNNDLITKTFGFSDSVIDLADGIRSIFPKSIISTPKLMFARNITNLSYCFSNNSNLTTISQDVFLKCPNVTNFSYCFYQNKGITIPSNLFDNATKATDFSYCFAGTYVTTIPNGLFDNNILAENFISCFYDTSIETIPSGLFDNCTNATDFKDCFYSTNITTIPEGLFDNNSLAINFAQCFAYSDLVTIPFNLFDNCTGITRINGCFMGCGNITSNIPDAWNKDKFPNISYYDKYAYRCENALNYADIPNSWKGL